MNKLVTLLFLFNVTVIYSQDYVVKYGDKDFMHAQKLSSSFKQNYVLNKKLPDGNYKVSIDKNSIVLTQGQYSNNLKQGLWKDYDENGMLLKTYQYNKGKITLTKIYDKNGNLKIKIVPIKNRLYKIESYYSTGEILGRRQYLKGKVHGDCIEYFLDGKIKSIKKYKNGIIKD